MLMILLRLTYARHVIVTGQPVCAVGSSREEILADAISAVNATCSHLTGQSLLDLLVVLLELVDESSLDVRLTLLQCSHLLLIQPDTVVLRCKQSI